MANLELTVSKVSAKGKTNGNFIHTFKTKGTKIGGIDMANGVRTYFASLKQPLEVGAELELDLNLFRITEREMTDGEGVVVTDDNDKPIVLKWLSAK